MKGTIAMPHWKGWLGELREGDPATRVRAARRLAEEPSLPTETAGPLMAALFDDAVDHEDWTDWNGSVVGGTDHYARDYALEALGKLGAAGLMAVLEAQRRRPAMLAVELSRLAAEAMPDPLLEAGTAACSELRTVLEAAAVTADLEATRKKGLANLAWVERETAAGGDRITVLIGRLAHPHEKAQGEAAKELGRTKPARQAAAALADALERSAPALGYLAAGEAGNSLGLLGPVLDEERVGKLVRACLAGKLFGVWGSLLAALPAHGQAARELRPMLRAWAGEGKPPRQIGADYHRQVRAAAQHGLKKLVELCGEEG